MIYIYIKNLPLFLLILLIKLEIARDLLTGVKSCFFRFVSGEYFNDLSTVSIILKMLREFTYVD